MGNGVAENFNKTIKTFLKKVAAEKPKDRYRYLGPLMIAVRVTLKRRRITEIYC